MRVLLAYKVVVPTGVGMPFSYLIAKAAKSLYSRGQQYQVSQYLDSIRSSCVQKH